MSERLDDGRDACACCDRYVPADDVVDAPMDTGPFTYIDDNVDKDMMLLRPTMRWEMPVCKGHKRAMELIVACATCGTGLPMVDAIVNSSGTVALCRPCNREENQ